MPATENRGSDQDGQPRNRCGYKKHIARHRAAPRRNGTLDIDQPVPAAYEIAPPGGRQTGQSKEKVHEGDVQSASPWNLTTAPVWNNP